MTRPIYRVSRDRLLVAVATLAACLVASTHTAPAQAYTSGAWWRASTNTAPTNLQQGQEAVVEVVATDIGNSEVNAASEPVTITDTLPAGLEVTAVKAAAGQFVVGGSSIYVPPQAECSNQATSVTCTDPGPSSLTSPKNLLPFEPLEVQITVKVASEATSNASGQVTVAGGGVAPITKPQSITVGGSSQFGVSAFELTAENEAGGTETQAGSHPFQLTTSIAVNQGLFSDQYTNLGYQGFPPVAKAVAAPKDLVVRLPPGLVGNATSLPQCSEADFSRPVTLFQNACPAVTAVGVAAATAFEPEDFQFVELPASPYEYHSLSRAWSGVATPTVPVYNLTPAPGEPARFGFDVAKNFVTLDTSVATGEDYAVVTGASNAPQIASLLSSQVTLWGTPGDPRHSRSRGYECLNGLRTPASCEALIKTEFKEYEESHPSHAGSEQKPFLRLPTSCQAPLKSSLLADSWPEPAPRESDGTITKQQAKDARWKSTSFESPPLEGCGQLPFSPSLKVEPETSSGSSPSGFKFDVHLPQVENETENAPAESDVKSTTVTLPQGVLLSPAAAHGLESCSEGQVGYLGKESLETEPGDSLALFTPTLPESGFCSSASKVGNVRIQTPLLEHEVEGGVYLAAQNANPFNSLIAMYIVAKDPVSGVVVKLAGQVTLNESTGQISTSFENTPQTPFEDLKLEFFGGQDASLTTPPYCGTHTATATFTPWSGNEPTTTQASFNTTSNCTNGGSQPFSPSFSAGPTNAQAGGYSPFTLTLGNPDVDQPLKNLTMHLPAGFAAMLSTVTPCPEAQAAQEIPQCGPASEIGHSTALSGLGGNPYALPGTAYLTGPYKSAPGAPFGILDVTPAKAGPFNLGDVNVHSAIYVNRETAAVTIATEPFPEYVKGIPSQLKEVNVEVNRPGFEFNPTNCSPMSITGTLTGSQGASQNVSQPVQVGNCAALPFKPKLTASTQGNASKANGAGLTVRVESGFGQANIAKTKLVLPITLPSRLTTIQKACVDSVFEANPAACDEGSNIGTAVAHTPVLKEPLAGPAYLVSHGNAAFPDVEFVLTNKEGIELILDGKTDIKKGITTSSFESVPDAPVSVFETVLPEGPHSALTSNVAASKKFSLCGAKLTIPTTITGQNGVVIKQETPVPVKGCGAVLGAKVSKAQQLTKALKKCRTQFKHNKKKRAACEKQARKKYGPKKKAKKKAKKKK
jgi:hypothetical protein